MAYSKIKKNGELSKPSKPKNITLDVFTRIANGYIQTCIDKKQIPHTIELAWLLGISQSALNYYRKKPAYLGIIKRIDEMTEIGLINKGLNDNKPVFSMFLLKAKYGYVEQQYQKVDFNVSGQIGVVQMPKKLK